MVQLDHSFWTLQEGLAMQRMTTKQWAEILLAGRDRIIVNGRCRTLVAKNLGYRVVEIVLKPLK